MSEEQKQGAAGWDPPEGEAPPPGSRGLGNKLWIIALVLIGVGAAGYQAYYEQRRLKMVHDGAEAADFTAERYKGGTVTLSDFRGKVVMLDFWATWCGPCQQEFPSLTKLAGEFQERGVVFIAADQIQSDSKAAVGVFLSQLGIEPPPNMHVVFAPDALFDRYQIQALPTLYFIDREGRVADAFQGLASEDRVRRRLEKLTQSGE